VVDREADGARWAKRGNPTLCHKLVLWVAPNRIIAKFAFFSLRILYVHTYEGAMFRLQSSYSHIQ
jgi:hypothetical protein